LYRFLTLAMAFLLIQGVSHASFAQSEIETPTVDRSAEPLVGGFRPFDLRLAYNLDKPRSVMWPAFFSFFIPGLDQWIENQHHAGFFYSGLGLTGMALANQAWGKIKDDDFYHLDPENIEHWHRQYILGSQIYQVAGSFSAYHSFRTAVRTQKKLGKYAFLKKEEHTGEILAAPFKFSYLKRHTTYLPLGGLAVAVAILVSADDEAAGKITLNESLYSGAISYNAGTGEEALFRGWIMPGMRQSMKSDFWSNTASAFIFAIAHQSEQLQVPWPQFVMGWYLGWLTQQNDWTLSESVFIHTWWDVIAFSAAYLAQSKTAYLPLIYAEF
jgi:membrane protease YdiL (CAAX protease family)